jgi:hypothetical protein
LEASLPEETNPFVSLRVRNVSLVPARLFAGTVAACLLLAGTPADAQQRNLRGIVTDSAGYPLPNVEIRIMDLGRMTRSDVNGAFRIDRISDRIVDLTVRRMGYQMRFVRVAMINGEGDSLRIVLRAEPLRLPEVVIEDAEEKHPFFNEYEKRRQRGIGTFLTRKDLDKLNTSYPSDAFRRLPGMRFVNVSGGMGVRFMSAVGMRGGGRGGDCIPTIWIDGQAAPGMEIDEIRAQDIHGMEIYRGASTVPSQFVKGGLGQCGAIVVWTRRKTK